MECWYLVVCKPKQEERAKTNLQNQGIEAFYPQLTTERLVKGRRTVKHTALFPNYLFVCLESKNGNFSAVKNTRGIGGFVSYGASYQLVSKHIIDQLKNERAQTIESKIPKTEQHGAVPVPPVAPLSMGLQQQMIDVNQLTTEQLERLLQERKAQEVVQTEQATLMAMDKEELVQIIIDNQVEF